MKGSNLFLFVLVGLIFAGIYFTTGFTGTQSLVTDVTRQIAAPALTDEELKAAAKAQRALDEAAAAPKNDDTGSVGTKSRQCGYGLPLELIEKKPYLTQQLIQTVGIPDSEFGFAGTYCSTEANETVRVFTSTTAKNCPAYPRPSAKCPSAVVNKLASGEVQIICNSASKTGCTDAAASEEGSGEDLTAGDRLPEEKLADIFEKINNGGTPTAAEAALIEQHAGNELIVDNVRQELVRRGVFPSDTTDLVFPTADGVVTGGEVITAGYTPTDGVVVNPTGGDVIVPTGSDAVVTPTGGDVITASYKPGGDAIVTPTGGDVTTAQTYSQSAYTTGGAPIRTTPSPTGPIANNQTYSPQSSQSPYRSFQNPQSLHRPQSFIQRFAGGNALNNLADFVTGAGALRNSPEGDRTGGPQVIYVTPEFTTPASINRENRTIEEIASDISAQTPTSLSRVDHFAQTLNAVGGPSSIDTENKSFGRIQDLIVEDEAIRALRVAEEEGKRAKNTVFCRANEAAEQCEERREEKAKEVERKVLIEELEKRVLPESAIQHFLAVYDGWVRPSPAPTTRATSTLSALHAQDLNPLAGYEITTGGTNFILWVMESVADATVEAVSTLVEIITGESKEDASLGESTN